MLFRSKGYSTLNNTYDRNLPLKPIEIGDVITADFLNRLVTLGQQSRLFVNDPIKILSQSATLGTTIGISRADRMFPVSITQDGGDAGGDKTDCSFTYSVKKIDGTAILSSATPDNSSMRFPGVEYTAGTMGIGFYKTDSTFGFVTLDEYWNDKQLYLHDSDAGYWVNADAVNGYLFMLPKTGVWNAKIEGLWENSPVQANDLTEVRWTN